jgi:hypothetical protein
MKKFAFGVILLIGFCATLNAQQVTTQTKANKEIVASITWNSTDGYFIQLQPLGYYTYNVLVDVDGQQLVFNVCQYMTAYQIPAHRHSKIRVKVLGWKSNELTFVVH